LYYSTDEIHVNFEIMIKNVRLNLLVFAILCITALAVDAQASITGRVIDDNHDPVEFANVVMYAKADSSFIKAEVSNEDGTFVFASLPNEPSYLELSFIGYELTQYTIEGPGSLGDLVLPSSSVQLDDITVKASRPMIMRDKDKLLVNVEGNVLSQGNDVLELLSKSPGVIVDYNDNLSLNGRAGVRIQIDGKDTRLQGNDLAGLLKSMSASNIDRIEIITNPSARYEAQGNAGIINIITLQSKFYGTNGRLELSPGHGRHFRWQNSLNINHRRKNMNLYGNYSFAKRNQYMEIIQDRQYFGGNSPDGHLEIQNDFILPIETHNAVLGMDLDLGEYYSLNLQWTGNYRNDGSEVENEILDYNDEELLRSRQSTVSDVYTTWQQNMTSLGIKRSFDNNGKLELTLDGALYKNASEEVYNSSFFNAGDVLQYKDRLDGSVAGDFRLGGISLDYVLNTESKGTFEMGLKTTWVQTDNALEYTNTIDGETTPNTDLSNHFIYNENINGIYASYAMSGEKWNAQWGLRLEDSNIMGNQLTTDSSFVNEYLNVFPSASFNYTINPDNILGLSMTRRIDRPAYSQLNPFRFFVNTNTFRSGNPLLRPQYSWSGEINYTFKQRYYMSFNVAYSKDKLSSGIIRDGDKQLVLITPLNIEEQWNYSLMLSLPVQISKNWTSNWSIHSSFLDFDGLVNGFAFDRSTLIAWINTNHNIEIGKGYRLQFGGFIIPPHYISITKVRTISSVNAGIQKAFMDGKARLRLNVNDIFYDYYPRGYTDFGDIYDEWLSYRDNQVVNLSFSLQFGKMSVRPPSKKRSSVQEELNRARQNNNSGD